MKTSTQGYTVNTIFLKLMHMPNVTVIDASHGYHNIELDTNSS